MAQQSSSAFQRTIVTSALPYTNGYIHLGHCAGAYLPADLYVRFMRLAGEDILYICGSDEYGVAIAITAEKEGTTPQAVCDKYHEANRSAFMRFGMSFDHYSRTTNPHHVATTQEFFTDLLAKGFLAEKDEEQFYDDTAQMFLPDRYVEGICPNCGYDKARGDQCDKCGAYYNQLELQQPRSLVTGNTPSVRKTTHWYFRLGEFQQPLETYIAGHTEWKDNVVQQSQSWLKQGLSDRAITRDLQWGVPVPDSVGTNEDGSSKAKGKVIYVWFDAVLGYVSGTKEWAEQRGTPLAWQTYWMQPDTRYLAFIGKDNIVFHALMFPAMLQAKGGYILPDNVPANEFLNLEGEKFSKSRHWAIDLREYLQDFPEDQHVDWLRYGLGMNLPETKDADFTWKDFQARVNNELASILGNFVNRSAQFMHKNFQGALPLLLDGMQSHEKFIHAWKLLIADLRRLRSTEQTETNKMMDELSTKYLHYFTPDDVRVITAFVFGSMLIEEKYRNFRFRDALTETMNLARSANKYFNDTAPWKSIKDNPTDCAKSLFVCAHLIRGLGIAFAPILPYSSQRILASVSAENTPTSWHSLIDPVLVPGTAIPVPSILFTKLEDDVVKAQIAKLGAGLPPVAAVKTVQQKKVSTKKIQDIPTPVEQVTPTSTPDNMITIDDVRNVELRTAIIRSAERVPKSDKLLKLRVDIGTEERQIIAGIGKVYEPETLVGMCVIAVVNLKPAKLMGHESQGMLLAADTADGGMSLLTLAQALPAGMIVK